MKSETKQGRSRRTGLLLVLLLVGGVLTAWALLRSGTSVSSVSSPDGPGGGTRFADSTPTEVASPQLGKGSDGGVGDPALRQGIDVDNFAQVTCLQSPGGEALSGVRMYREGEVAAGPSDREGKLEVRDESPLTVIFWAEGWVPIAARGEALPAEISLERADLSLELRFLNGSPDHRLLRSVLQPRGPGALAEGPWSPVLLERAMDLWVAEGVPAGEYDLYVWVTYPDGEPRPFSHRAFQVEANQPTRLTIDLAAPQSSDALESDS